jgi:sulfate transport system permease protein
MDVEEVAATLGASRLQTIGQVILPRLVPAILTGFALAFSRAVGEYGSVIFIASNIPYQSEIAPLLIVIRMQEFNQPAAAAIGAVMLVIAFVMLLVINLLQSWSRRRFGDGE